MRRRFFEEEKGKVGFNLINSLGLFRNQGYIEAYGKQANSRYTPSVPWADDEENSVWNANQAL